MALDNPNAFGAYLASIHMRGPTDARLLKRALEAAMRELAGKAGEKRLAEWHAETSRILAQAGRERWTGWESLHPSPSPEIPA